MREIKTVKIGEQECMVETLREWVNGRMAQIRKSYRTSLLPSERINFSARLAELSIIRQKVNDGRIQEIG